MFLDAKEIKVIRKKLGITQKKLAAQAGVSQSMIAKIESGLIDPSYAKAKRIFEVLEVASQKEGVKAGDLMNSPLIWIGPNETIKDASQKMKKHNISQLPVIDRMMPIGTLSETSLLDALTKKMDENTPVKKIMNSPPPIIEKNASVNAITGLLKYYPMVLVQEKERFAGVITKADIITKIYK